MGDEDDRKDPRTSGWRMMLARLATSASLSAEVGSSMTIRRERIDSARAISTICCSATERSRTSVIGSRSRPILSVIARVSAAELSPADEQLRAGLAADEHVLGDRHVGREREFLIDRDDAGALRVVRRGEGDRLAEQFDSFRRRPLARPTGFSAASTCRRRSRRAARESRPRRLRDGRRRARARRESAC